jgi:bacterioferritin-associated ferredoxin
MYVCICNAVRESEIEQVIAEGVRDVEAVYEALDVEPQCGTCRAYIREMMAEVPSALPSVTSAKANPELAA